MKKWKYQFFAIPYFMFLLIYLSSSAKAGPTIPDSLPGSKSVKQVASPVTGRPAMLDPEIDVFLKVNAIAEPMRMQILERSIKLLANKDIAFLSAMMGMEGKITTVEKKASKEAGVDFEEFRRVYQRILQVGQMVESVYALLLTSVMVGNMEAQEPRKAARKQLEEISAADRDRLAKQVEALRKLKKREDKIRQNRIAIGKKKTIKRKHSASKKLESLSRKDKRDRGTILTIEKEINKLKVLVNTPVWKEHGKDIKNNIARMEVLVEKIEKKIENRSRIREKLKEKIAKIEEQSTSVVQRKGNLQTTYFHEIEKINGNRAGEDTARELVRAEEALKLNKEAVKSGSYLNQLDQATENFINKLALERKKLYELREKIEKIIKKPVMAQAFRDLPVVLRHADSLIVKGDRLIDNPVMKTVAIIKGRWKSLSYIPFGAQYLRPVIGLPALTDEELSLFQKVNRMAKRMRSDAADSFLIKTLSQTAKKQAGTGRAAKDARAQDPKEVLFGEPIKVEKLVCRDIGMDLKEYLCIYQRIFQVQDLIDLKNKLDIYHKNLNRAEEDKKRKLSRLIDKERKKRQQHLARAGAFTAKVRKTKEKETLARLEKMPLWEEQTRKHIIKNRQTLEELTGMLKDPNWQGDRVRLKSAIGHIEVFVKEADLRLERFEKERKHLETFLAGGSYPDNAMGKRTAKRLIKARQAAGATDEELASMSHIQRGIGFYKQKAKGFREKLEHLKKEMASPVMRQAIRDQETVLEHEGAFTAIRSPGVNYGRL